MPKLIVTTRQSERLEIFGSPHMSVMETIRNAGLEDVFAVCGGCCSCATCHVFVDEAFGELLPAMSEDEDALLDSTDWRRPNSRLSCQIPFTGALDGLRVQIAPED